MPRLAYPRVLEHAPEPFEHRLTLKLYALGVTYRDVIGPPLLKCKRHSYQIGAHCIERISLGIEGKKGLSLQLHRQLIEVPCVNNCRIFSPRQMCPCLFNSRFSFIAKQRLCSGRCLRLPRFNLPQYRQLRHQTAKLQPPKQLVQTIIIVSSHQRPLEIKRHRSIKDDSRQFIA